MMGWCGTKRPRAFSSLGCAAAACSCLWWLGYPKPPSAKPFLPSPHPLPPPSPPLQEAVAAECSTLRWGDFKPRLADALVAHLQPIQVRGEQGGGAAAGHPAYALRHPAYALHAFSSDL